MRIREMFVGQDGLRAGWRFLLFALGIELFGQYLAWPLGSYLALRFGIGIDELSAPAMILSELMSLATVLLVTGVAALCERRRIDSYGLPVNQAFGLYFW